MINGSKLTFVRVRVPVCVWCVWCVRSDIDFGGIVGQRSWKAYNKELNGVLNELPQKTDSRTGSRQYDCMSGVCKQMEKIILDFANYSLCFYVVLEITITSKENGKYTS